MNNRKNFPLKLEPKSFGQDSNAIDPDNFDLYEEDIYHPDEKRCDDEEMAESDCHFCDEGVENDGRLCRTCRGTGVIQKKKKR